MYYYTVLAATLIQLRWFVLSKSAGSATLKYEQCVTSLRTECFTLVLCVNVVFISAQNPDTSLNKKISLVSGLVGSAVQTLQ